MEYQEDELVLCTVDKIDRSVVFVKLPDGREGTIISSEIVAGKIKNMREFVVPNKKIVCKVLRVSGDHIDLSLRRVNAKEKSQVLQEFKQTQAIIMGLKTVLGKDFEKTQDNILADYNKLTTFVEKAREDTSILKKYFTPTKIETIEKILEKKKKQVELHQQVQLKCMAEDGVKKIKEIFTTKNSRLKVTYISAGNFRLTLSSEDFKQAKQEMQDIVEEISKKAKAYDCEIEFKEIK